MKKGKLVVIEGTDGSGKSTQFRLLLDRLMREKCVFKHVTFPRYSEPSSALIRMYLGGEFGGSPDSVNAYAASTFYAVDRYASYKQDWGEWYENGGIVLTDRYTTSNAVHQASKVKFWDRRNFLDFLYSLEYEKFGLPKPDLVIYLDVPTNFTDILLRKRESEGGSSADIHEKDTKYLSECRKTGKSAAKFYGWTTIDCVKKGVLRSTEDIHEEIYSHVLALLKE